MDNFSFLNAAHSAYFADLYDQYIENPDSLEPSWRAFFQGYDFGTNNNFIEEIVDGVTHQIPDNVKKEFNVINLIDAYRSRGHLFTKTNPVRDRRTYNPNLSINNFDLSESDLDKIFNAGDILGIGPQPLKVIIQHLEAIYCDAIGLEYMYIRSPKKRKWIQNWINKNDNHPTFSPNQKKHILKKLVQAVSFENFLHTKYVGQKRFSLEGGESLIPALDSLIENAANLGVQEFVMGMAHRGRLNTLTNIFGKSPKAIFSEFFGKSVTSKKDFEGDVKYHLGTSSDRHFDNIKVQKDDFNITKITYKMKAKSTQYAQRIYKKEDPTELFIGINEFCWNILKDQRNNSIACYWLEWILGFEDIYKKEHKKYSAGRRSNMPVDSSYQKDIIWIIWIHI